MKASGEPPSRCASAIGAAAVESDARLFQTASSDSYVDFPLKSRRKMAAEYSAKDSVSHCSSSDSIFTTCPQYWCAISCANRSLTPVEKNWFASPMYGLN